MPLSPHVSTMTLIHPQHSHLGSESNLSSRVGTYDICIMVGTLSNLLTPAWESGRGRKGVELWVEMVGEDRGCTSPGWQSGRGQVATVGELYSRWRRRAGGRHRSHRRRGGCCSAAAGTARG